MSSITSSDTALTTPSGLALKHRPRRLRRTDKLRRMVQESHLTVADLIYPVFVMEGSNLKEEIASMPGCYRCSLDLLLSEVTAAAELGIPAIALFPLIPYAQKDNAGTESYNPQGLVPRAIRAIRQAVPDMIVITDVALDPYSTEGHISSLNCFELDLL